jgi:hypothetical protein
MQKNPNCIKILLWIGVALFLLLFICSTLIPDHVLPALGISVYSGFIIRLYGIFQLSWAILFFFALKDVEKNLAIINSGIITGVLVTGFYVIYYFVVIKSGGYLLINATILFIYTVLLFLCKPKPKSLKEKLGQN